MFCCPYRGLVANRDAQAAKNMLGHGLSVLRELDPDLYKQCIHGTSLAGGADGCCIPDSGGRVMVTCYEWKSGRVAPLPLCCCLC